MLSSISRTVDELAQALDLTHTTVRAHLTALERDGLVQQRNQRRGSRKPSAVNDLAPNMCSPRPMASFWTNS